jgi:hypothetical protein
MREYPWLRRLAGWAWLTVWSVLLYVVASPWKELGGIVDERLRWFHRFSLCMGLASGAVAGLHGREAPEYRQAGFRRLFYRVAWYVMAGSAAILMVCLAASGGREGEIGIVLTGFLAFWAGLDGGISIFPLLHGRSPDDPDEPAGDRISM